MFIEITWVLSGFSGYLWLDTKNVLKTAKKSGYVCSICVCCNAPHICL